MNQIVKILASLLHSISQIMRLYACIIISIFVIFIDNLKPSRLLPVAFPVS